MKLRNKYYILRHGEAISNVKQIVSSWPEKFKNPLTDNGKKQIKEAANKLQSKRIDLIFASDLLRTKQTANIVAKTLNLGLKFDKSSTTFKKIKVVLDKRLREVGFGAINGRPAEELLYLSFEKDRLKKSFKRSETYEGVLKRVFGFFKEIDKKYSSPHQKFGSGGKGKNILLVSHQCPLWILENHVKGFSLAEGLKRNPLEKRIGRGEIRELN